MSLARIRLRGYPNAKVIDDIFSSQLVDCVSVDEVGPDYLLVVGDVGVDFDDPKEFFWGKSIIERTLLRNGIRGITIDLANKVSGPSD